LLCTIVKDISLFNLYLPTTLNRIIATASLIIPSPNITENNLGYCNGLISVSAATESVAQIVALNFMMKTVDKITACESFHKCIH